MDVDLHYCIRLLQSCTTRPSIRQVGQLHPLLLKNGLLSSAVTVANRLLQWYVRCDGMIEARRVFDEMPHRNRFTWNALIEGCTKSGDLTGSMELLRAMPDRDEFSWNVVISGFIKSGDLANARALFDEMPRKDGVTWNSTIHGYARNGFYGEAVRLFRDMIFDPMERRKADSFVFATILRVCTDREDIESGKQIHARAFTSGIEFDSGLASSLINLYVKCRDLDSATRVVNSLHNPDDFSLSAIISGYAGLGRMGEARRIFNRATNPCAVVWNSLISGHVYNNEGIEALALFNQMRKTSVSEDSSTLATILGACSSQGFIEQGKQVHSHGTKMGFVKDIVVASALIDMYHKCGSPNDACKFFSELGAYDDTILLNTMITAYSSSGKIEDARRVFDSISCKSLISWNSMIAGFAQNGCSIEALDLLCELNRLGLKMDKFSLASGVSACASISAFNLGEQIFCRAFIIGLESDSVVSTSLIDFYCKGGFVEIGRKIFNGMTKSDEVPWNTMLMGYATNGHGMKALSLFNEMTCAGLRPTGITFTGVLSACDHCGLVEEGKKWFDVMKRDYYIDHGLEHYSCMVDLLSRAGRLHEAVSLLEQMPFTADATMWSSVLRGCGVNGDKILGEKVAERIMELDPQNSSAYVQLSAMLAESGDWERSAMVRDVMKGMRIQKSPGFSWAEC
ncbi:putative pentatricopeptide repeat-containing protein At1g77010, mitochondrial [Punica granatum]|uniref:Uncharacterized protein n=2 Tax=Punica granatum TaxID=22663 RepID=A0A218XEU6_PUNGR|nr:putative pentatricopeptide repeat-containing protein At1g77010, mitochondrial [Punica granatum]OWM83001.1 hypothetical protein CDL15_Pgr005401 [Punica granatum]PKI48352.1 hypothetical protein CRG98_031300 [Punica granatum]